MESDNHGLLLRTLGVSQDLPCPRNGRAFWIGREEARRCCLFQQILVKALISRVLSYFFYFIKKLLFSNLDWPVCSIFRGLSFQNMAYNTDRARRNIVFLAQSTPSAFPPLNSDTPSNFNTPQRPSSTTSAQSAQRSNKNDDREDRRLSHIPSSIEEEGLPILVRTPSKEGSLEITARVSHPRILNLSIPRLSTAGDLESSLLRPHFESGGLGKSLCCESSPQFYISTFTEYQFIKACKRGISASLYSGYADQLRNLLRTQGGLNLGCRGPKGWSPLHYAVHFDQAEIVTILINAGAYVDPVNNSNATPLYLAVCFFLN
jgi:hypothetical protein